jgi:basic membrane protein A and related proteins
MTRTLLLQLKRLAKKTGVEILKKTNISETQACYDAAAELVDEGCNVIFADSFGHEPYIIQAAVIFYAISCRY